MAARVIVVDYGIGNVFSVCHALRHAGAEPTLSADVEVIRQADRLILPGVGAFGRAMDELQARALVDPILDFIRRGRPFLGLCVGMQMLMDRSEELGPHQGLGLLAGTVERIPARTVDGESLRVPHIGWTELLQSVPSESRPWARSILADTSPGRTAFYFVHSFAVHLTDPAAALAQVDYGGWPITAAVQHENIQGVQFHPERSGLAGQKLLRRFMSM
jgi:glutamine amidotransferase